MEKISSKLGLSRSQSIGVGGVSSSRELSSSSSTGRPASIALLDERRLELVVQSRLYAGELLDLVASHCGLKEKEYFGLALQDENGLYSWLTLDRKVLDHDLPRKPSTLTIHFLVKFFVESISHLADNKTVEFFYLQARSLIFKGTLEVESDIVFQLAALGLQATYSDYVDESTSRSLIKKSPILPASILKENSSTVHCENRVIEHYKKTKGQTRGQALVNYMTIVESMPTYGVHYFEVFDRKQNLCWLGLSCKGIAQYDHSDRKVPVWTFQWKQLENLYFRDRKFSVEVHDAKRVVQTLSPDTLYKDSLKLENGEENNGKDSELLDAINNDITTRVSTSRRSFHPGSIRVCVWLGKTGGLTKCIWQSAISQHQFYLDRKQAKARHQYPSRSLKEIARDLTRSSVSLSSNSSLSNLSRQSSTQSLAYPGAVGGVSIDQLSEETRRARVEMIAALKARREALESKLKEKTILLKDLCLKEGELTGVLPPEIPITPGDPPPVIRRRVGTKFALDAEAILAKSRVTSPQEELLANLELDRAIQTKITDAALKISNDLSVSKSVRKQRKISHQLSVRKCKEIESKISALKTHIETEKRKKESLLKRGISVPDLEGVEEPIGIPESDSCPTSPRKRQESSPMRLAPTGYIPNSIYSRSSYRAKNYPTFSSTSLLPPPLPPLSTTLSGTPYRNKYELNSHINSPVGLYNIPQQRTSQAFSSIDDLDGLNSSSPVSTTRLEAAASNYPSLERSARRKKPNQGKNNEIRRSLEDLRSLEASGLRGRSKMKYEEIPSSGEPEDYSWQRYSGGPYPSPLRTTLLPGQTYPDPTPAINLNLSIQEALLRSPTNGDDPPPLYPKQYQMDQQRRRSGLMDRSSESPVVNRKVKPPLGQPESSDSPTGIGDGTPKYFKETTKPFEMADFYKYSTKFRKASASSLKSESSSSSSSASGQPGLNPPELPARTSNSHPPPVTSPKPSKPPDTASLGDSFSSEMLAWYNNKKGAPQAGDTGNNSNQNNKSATLV